VVDGGAVAVVGAPSPLVVVVVGRVVAMLVGPGERVVVVGSAEPVLEQPVIIPSRTIPTPSLLAMGQA
jgi:hypothetical protein